MLINKVLACEAVFELLVIKFLANDLTTVSRTSKSLHKQIKDHLEKSADIVCSKFTKQYGNHFGKVSRKAILSSQSNLQSTNRLPRQTRINIQLTFTVGESLSNNKSYLLGYSYDCSDKKKHKKQRLFWELQFDVVSGERCIWMYREETRNHFAKGKVPLVQDIMPVRKGDTLHLNLAYLTSFGFSLLSSLQFYPIVEERTHEHFSSVQNLFQWTLHKYLEHPVQFEVEDIIRCYPEYLHLQEMRCSGVGFYNYRIKLRCLKKGLVGDLIGHDLEIVGKDQAVAAVLKKKGAYDQERTKIQLRVGDTLLIYFTPNE